MSIYGKNTESKAFKVGKKEPNHLKWKDYIHNFYINLISFIDCRGSNKQANSS